MDVDELKAFLDGLPGTMKIMSWDNDGRCYYEVDKACLMKVKPRSPRSGSWVIVGPRDEPGSDAIDVVFIG